MINFNLIENQLESFQKIFQEAKPFPFLVIDKFAEEDRLIKSLSVLPKPDHNKINKSRDYIFAKNKYEKSNFKELSVDFNELYQDLNSDKFCQIIQEITGENIFIDSSFHGGGLHIGGENSFLDMHVDFNYHPINKNWFRNLNILLYLNKDWQQEYGGQLKLKHLQTGETKEVEPIFNRCVIMLSGDYTLHGYDKINFPPNQYRYSIASYAYSLDSQPKNMRSTLWIPENSSNVKKLIGKSWPLIIKLKNSILASGTTKNK